MTELAVIVFLHDMLVPIINMMMARLKLISICDY